MLDEMSTQLDPSPYSERELSLTAISLTFRRARAAQHELSLDPVSEAGRMAKPLISRNRWVDDDLSKPNLEDGDEAQLPHPLATDGFLRHCLEQAAVHQGGTDAGLRGLLWRITTRRRARRQAYFNSVVVNALHQFDHRTCLQQQAIGRLEAETAAIRRAVNTLEARSYRSP